jgi:hypothetical protein
MLLLSCRSTKYIQVNRETINMTIGKITSSQQDIAYASVMPEDGSYIETTQNQENEESAIITSSAGQEFNTAAYFGRIKLPLSAAYSTFPFSIWDSPAKVISYHKLKLNNINGQTVGHFAFDPLPPGYYYWELSRSSGTLGLTKANGSTYPGTYLNATLQNGFSWKSKIMLTPLEVIRPLAIKGDAVDAGVTTIKEGSAMGAVQVGEVIGNIARVGDILQNGGVIRTGAWHIQIQE